MAQPPTAREFRKIDCGSACIYPPQMEAAERAMVEQRRAAAGLPTLAQRDRIGVALSGGGIRSATFALGFFQALARLKLVRHFDDLSTVSGGGYFGAFLGRLFGRDWVVPPKPVAGAPDPGERVVDRVEEALIGAPGEFTYDRPAGSDDGEPSRTTIQKRGALRQLRDNGYYLAPRGRGDLLLFGAALLRNFLALQGLLLLSLAALLLLPRFADALLALSSDASARALLGPLFGASDERGDSVVRFVLEGTPVVFWLSAATIVLGVIPCLLGYWIVADPRGGTDGRKRVALAAAIPSFLAVVSAALLALAWRAPVAATTHSLVVRAAPAAIALFSLVAALLARSTISHRDDIKRTAVHRCRSLMTRWMTRWLIASAVLLLLVVVELIGAWLQQQGVWTGLKRVGALLGGGTALAAFARSFVMNFAGDGRQERPGWWSRALAWAGAIGWTLILLVSADVVARAAAAGAANVTFEAYGLDLADLLASPDRPLRLAIAAIGVVTVLGLFLGWLLGRERTFLNLSSHNILYASRLTRAYLGASNPARIYGRVKLSGSIDSDDATVADYWQHARGAPLHYLNTTINESVDGREGIQLLTPRALPFTLGPAGLSAGKNHHFVTRWSGGDDEGGAPPVDCSLAPKHEKERDKPAFAAFADGFTPEPLTIGRWTSISGAAFSTGLGTRTSLGMSLLCGLANVRLGWWYDSSIPQEVRGGSKVLLWLDRAFFVHSHLVRELLGRFHGVHRRLWYLSDGGHFENMGAFELVRRRVRHVVVVDGECDPDYTFEGIGHLVRLARVELGTEIRFVGEAELDRLVAPEQRRYFGSLDHLVRGRWEETGDVGDEQAGREEANLVEATPAGRSLAHAALAEVRYADGTIGQLVYVKSTLMGDEPVDLAHYHAAHPSFPHETTADQFFDTTQWESYRKLGELIGARLFAPGQRPLTGRVARDGGAPTWGPSDLLKGVLAAGREGTEE